MEDKKIAISLSGVKKQYRLGEIGGKTLQGDLQSWWARCRGKEDPNVRVGQDQRLIGSAFMALNGIDLTVYQGEALGIIGCNGAGKSTLLKLLSRVTAPTEGEIDLYGRVSSMLEVGTGFNGQMTGRENIYLNGAILGMRKKEIDARIEDIIDFSEVREFIDTPVKRYSSGMFVKLAFAVAAHLNSEIMIMDEVLAVGDMAFQKKCLAKMRSAAMTEGRTVLYVSHNMNTIRELCGRCVVLDQGKILFDGDVETAIAVYMNHNAEENAVDIALAGKSVTRESVLSLERLVLSGKVVPTYQPDEDLRFLLTVTAKEPISRLRLRLTFRNDADVGIGTAWSEILSAEAGNQTIPFAMPLSQLAKGTFYVSLGLYRVDEIGRNLSLSHITRAFRIELPGLPIWNTRAHGYVQLPEITVGSTPQSKQE